MAVSLYVEPPFQLPGKSKFFSLHKRIIKAIVEAKYGHIKDLRVWKK